MSRLTQPRCLLLQVIDTHYHATEALADMTELEQLVDTFGGVVVEKAIQHRVKPHPATYVGPGKMEWLKERVKEAKIEVVILNDILKSAQLFRIEQQLWEVNTRIAVWDRVDLILNIFERHASTREAKLQIELARIAHQGPRIYGLGKTVLSRQGGGIGTRGLGETNIERERRLMKDRQRKLRVEIEGLMKKKSQRLGRRTELGIGPVALVGYTSAGKTTLFNRLTGKEKQTHKGLFTTLDTVVGQMPAEGSPMPVLVSDTIGFIQDLPPSLIDAFRTTLMESMEAKVVLHVIDVTDERRDEKIKVVDQILDELGSTQPRVRVFNKVDVLKNGEVKVLGKSHAGSVFVSAKKGDGIEALKRKVVEELKRLETVG